MRVLLAGPDFEENLSIRYLSAALLHAGHDTELVPFNSSSDTEAVARAADGFDIVGLSMCFQSRAQEYLHLARVIKSADPRKLIIAGGHYASCAAESLLRRHPEIDVIVIHEGEATLVDIADSIRRAAGLGDIPGIGYRGGERVRFTTPRRTVDELDILPFPDRRGPIHLIAGVPTSYMMGSRGCYGSCAYCCITTLHRIAPGKRFRQRSAGQIAEEMAELYHHRGTRQFIFHDDNFLVPSEAMNHARISALEQELNRRGVRDIALVIKCRPADAKRDVLHRLKEMGLVRLFLGIESSTEQGLSTLERRQTVDESMRALDACAQLDISAQFTIMTFNPDATEETLRSDIAFMRRYSGNPLNFCRAEIYAGTPLEARMIAQGRARGNYLARVYDLSDPLAALACELALKVFNARCWVSDSLMQNAIGLDHLAAVARRFYSGPHRIGACDRVASWLRAVNLDTINLLEEVVELSESCFRSGNTILNTELEDIRERESVVRKQFLREAMLLRAEISAFRLPGKGDQSGPIASAGLRFARQATAALLAVGLPGIAAGKQAPNKDVQTPVSTPTQNDRGLTEYAAAPLEPEVNVKDLDLGPIPQSTSSIIGTVTDSSGAVIANSSITITNVDSGAVENLKTNQEGRYEAKQLAPGHYTVKTEYPGFKTAVVTGIVLEAGTVKRIDVQQQIGSYECCEYAASPLQVEEVDYLHKKKPFTYYVGDAKDHNTFQGIAEVVYGDRREWPKVFEANRNQIAKPGFIPNGTSISIPKKKHNLKLAIKVKPEYPAQARAEHVFGDVIIDVTLKPDGTVDRVDVIDGPAPLVDAAATSVKQWRYRLSPHPQPTDLKFVVAITFTKGGKVKAAP